MGLYFMNIETHETYRTSAAAPNRVPRQTSVCSVIRLLCVLYHGRGHCSQTCSGMTLNDLIDAMNNDKYTTFRSMIIPPPPPHKCHVESLQQTVNFRYINNAFEKQIRLLSNRSIATIF